MQPLPVVFIKLSMWQCASMQTVELTGRLQQIGMCTVLWQPYNPPHYAPCGWAASAGHVTACPAHGGPASGAAHPPPSQLPTGPPHPPGRPTHLSNCHASESCGLGLLPSTSALRGPSTRPGQTQTLHTVPFTILAPLCCLLPLHLAAERSKHEHVPVSTMLPPPSVAPTLPALPPGAPLPAPAAASGVPPSGAPPAPWQPLPAPRPAGQSAPAHLQPAQAGECLHPGCLWLHLGLVGSDLLHPDSQHDRTLQYCLGGCPAVRLPGHSRSAR